MQFFYNLLLLFLLLFCISSVDAANAINCRQQETVMRVKRQTFELSLQQQYPQRQRNLHEQGAPQTSSVVKPMVKYFVATPGQQVQQLQANSGGGQQRFAFTSQQQQQQYVQPFRPQQQQAYVVPSSSPTQLASSQQYFPSNSYLQRQQQQQFYNITNFSRVGQQPQQQQQHFQTQPPQQFHQPQQQLLQFFKPQITTTTTNLISQYNNSNQQPTSPYAPQIPAQRQQESTPTANKGNDADAQVLTPLLPSYSDDDDIPLNYTRTCEMCCMPGQTPCQDCCDTNPLLSLAVLKSSAG